MANNNVRAGRHTGCEWVCALALAAAVVLPACGKKGAPLPPLLRVPAAADNVGARRLGDTVYVQFTVPARNQDNSTPADVRRVDVYGFTGTPQRDDDVIRSGTVVARVIVRPPPPPDKEAPRDKEKTPAKKGEAGGTSPKAQAKKAAPPEPGVDQGTVVTITETLTPALMQAVARVASPAEQKGAPKVPPKADAVLTRHYIVVGVNHKGRQGLLSRGLAIPVGSVPPAPADVKATFTEKQIAIAWAPVAVDEASAAGTQAPTMAYNVYDVPSSRATAAKAAAPAAPGALAFPVPLNDKPLTATTFSDSRLEFGTERCYAVRAVRLQGSLAAEGEPSSTTCIEPTDIFPPAAPKGLTVVATAGAMSLIWEPSPEADLEGYLVLRGEATGAKLQPITPTSIRETTFSDTTAKPGVRYVYAVVAIDKSGNISAQSNRVEETAR